MCLNKIMFFLFEIDNIRGTGTNVNKIYKIDAYTISSRAKRSLSTL